MWLSKIHDKMVDCVRIEFASELRGEKQLIELMPRIADNVDNILSRHNIKDNSALSPFRDQEDADGYEQDIRRFNGPPFSGTREGSQRFRGAGLLGESRRRDRGGGHKFAASVIVPNCPHCVHLSKTLRLKINTRHALNECVRKDIVIRLAEDDQLKERLTAEEDDYGSSICTLQTSSNAPSQLQIERPPYRQKHPRYQNATSEEHEV